MSVEPIALLCVNHEAEDSCIKLDEETSADKAQQARPRGCQESPTVSHIYRRKLVF